MQSGSHLEKNSMLVSSQLQIETRQEKNSMAVLNQLRREQSST
jgi:hypothetical protein